MELRSRNVHTKMWPALPFGPWKETCETLHLWTQIVGKVRLALSPHLNHWWQVPLYVTARGLTTSPIAIPGSQGQIFEVQFDFLVNQLFILTSFEQTQMIPLQPRSVADFYQEFLAALHKMGIEVTINPVPCEVAHPIAFDQDHIHASYDPKAVGRFWRVLVQVSTIMKEFRARFLGKCSPVHFFWGSFDLAVTRFSGRRAPEREGADSITREAYSHEVSSCGFWPGNEAFPEPAFYAYSYPEPAGFPEAAVQPAAAFYHPTIHEFLLRYEDMRKAADPEQALLAFCQSTYEAEANLAHWDREALER